MTPPLTILGWDHPRCMDPLRAAAATWEARPDGGPVVLTARGGDAFAGQPLAVAIEHADLVIVDHPFAGEGFTTGTLVPVDAFLSAATLASLAADSVGPSHASYVWQGHQMAIAADAACHAAAWRPDLLGGEVPQTWGGVLELARRRPGSVGLTIVDHASICALLTLCAGAGCAPAPDDDPFLDPAAAERALEWMAELLTLAHPASRTFAVDRMLALMIEDDELAYMPLAFPYTTFATATAPNGPVLAYGPPPTELPGIASVGALLGGTGLAIGAGSRQPQQAAAFAAWYGSADVQRELVVPAGGQPASRAAWSDRDCDARLGGFFSSVLPTLEHAYVRPREPWWPPVQREADELICAALLAGEPAAVTVARLERVFDAARGRD